MDNSKQWCAGKLALQKKKKEKLRFVTFANFPSVSAPTLVRDVQVLQCFTADSPQPVYQLQHSPASKPVLSLSRVILRIMRLV